MRSYNFSRLLELVDSNFTSLWPSGERKNGTEKAAAPRLSRKRDLFLAFFIVSLPLLVIAILLLVFTFHDRENPASYVGIPLLPLQNYSTDAFYTTVDAGNFLLVGSWASNIAAIIVAPFMVLFSYAVAREIIQHEKNGHEDSGPRPPLLREIMRGAHVGVWHWVGQNVFKISKTMRGKGPLLRVVDVAGIGLVVATLLAIMVLVGDNWLHIATESFLITHYDYPTNYTYNQENYDPTNTTLSTLQAGFKANGRCNNQLNSDLPQNVSAAPPPCSLNITDDFTNVANPKFVYLTLGTGISQISSDFNGLNFTNAYIEEQEDTATAYQVVTYQPPGADVSHSLLFYPDAAAEYTMDFGDRFGIDYVANSTSMVTQCTYATQECDVHSTHSTDGNNISIPFDCYPGFSGNLGQTPATGHERAQGWNMSFYQLINGTPTNIPVQAQSNPFNFYVATAVNSIQLSDFLRHNSDSPEGSFVDGGQGFTAFALSCEATIYDVTFSIINGSFDLFDYTISSPQKANIVQAPLQIGFGQYHLYEAAATAVLAKNTSVAVSMGKAFSQTGMALASGVFDLDNNIWQRYRWNLPVTRVPKAPLFYLVVVCLVYAMFGMVMTILALLLRRRPEVRDQQKRLMVEWGPDLRELDIDGEGEGEEGKKKREKRGDERSARSSSDVASISS